MQILCSILASWTHVEGNLHMKFSALNTILAVQVPTFKEACAFGCQIRVPPKKVVMFPLLACLAWKWLQIGTDMLRIITSTGDMLFIGVNIKDLELFWTPKLGFLVIFVIFGCRRVNCNEMDGHYGHRPRLPANGNCYKLSHFHEH